MREEVKNWFLQAKRDLVTAKNSFSSEDYYASAFWCQQACEKGLKAVIIEKTKDKFVPEHSLIKLGKSAEISEGYLKKLKLISPQYFLSRYPDASEDLPEELYDEEMIKEFIKITGEVMRWVESQLK